MSEENYQPPLADLTPNLADNSEEQDWADFIGPNGTDYYLERFRRVSQGGTLTWHWPSFFLTLGWLFYRKFWLVGLAYLIVLPVLLSFVVGLLAAAFDASGILAAYAVYFGFVFLVVPLYANRLYLARARRKIANINAQAYAEAERREKLMRAGGTNLPMAIIITLVPIVFIGLVAAISIPAYNDYTVRAQVSEGFSLAGAAKVAVAEYYEETDTWPVDNQAAGLEDPAAIRGNYVESVMIDAGVIVVTYGGEAAHQSIQGKQLILNPDADLLPLIDWVCYSPDIPSKHLPARCRE
jgi:Tfp pilus assembly major pilin PilA